MEQEADGKGEVPDNLFIPDVSVVVAVVPLDDGGGGGGGLGGAVRQVG